MWIPEGESVGEEGASVLESIDERQMGDETWLDSTPEKAPPLAAHAVFFLQPPEGESACTVLSVDWSSPADAKRGRSTECGTAGAAAEAGGKSAVLECSSEAVA